MEVASVANGWVNTPDSINPEILAQVRRIIASNIYCTLSTCSVDCMPWASPVFFAFDDTFNFYWSSAIASKHSQNLYSNAGRIAIAIFDSRPPNGIAEGVYFSGTAAEVQSREDAKVALERLLARARRKHNRTVDDYLGDSPRRIYQFQPQEVWVTGERIAVDNQLVDTKVYVSLADLIS
ncbi:MAG: pyridoxamine 5'-phosphate oxidase family protein [Leptolyngbyaceae cyanobacterium MO_188.B28]|nr:pyridoxamine 5'-phosphate oxidase family protein [Leptolyngbyaceae cyanobacterium MO_188.B28]